MSQWADLSILWTRRIARRCKRIPEFRLVEERVIAAIKKFLISL